MRRIVREAALDDGAEGSRWLEIQVDPTSYAPFVGGITPALEIVLDEARAVSCGARGGAGRRDRGGEPDAAPAGGAHAGAAGGAARRVGAGDGRRVRAVERRAARGDRGVRARLRDRAAGRADAACRTPASCWGRRRWPRRSTRSGRSGWATGCGRWRTRGCWSGSCARAWRSRCARCRTSSLGVYDVAAGRAAARPGGCRGARRARGRRPADLRVAAGRPVRDGAGGPRVQRRRAGVAGARRRWRRAGRRRTWWRRRSATSTPGSGTTGAGAERGGRRRRARS